MITDKADQIVESGLQYVEELISAPQRIIEKKEQDEKYEEAVAKSATTTLKLFADTTRRNSQETNRAAVQLRVAQAMGKEGNQLAPIWDGIAPDRSQKES